MCVEALRFRIPAVWEPYQHAHCPQLSWAAWEGGGGEVSWAACPSEASCVVQLRWSIGELIQAERSSQPRTARPPLVLLRSGQQQAQHFGQVAGAVRSPVQPCTHGTDRQLWLHGAGRGAALLLQFC